MSLAEFGHLAANLGFPVFVAVYLLWERRGIMGTMRQGFFEMRDAMRDLSATIRERVK